MKKFLAIYLITIGVTAIVSLLLATDDESAFGFIFGLLNLLAGGAMLFIGIIMLIAGAAENGKHVLIAGGLVLLTGGIACSIYPFTLNG